MKIIHTFESKDGKKRLHIFERDNGFYSFSEEYEDS
jgi:hypothetical protein